MGVRFSFAVCLAIVLTGCAGGTALDTATPPATAAAAPGEISGRWVLSAPNAPFCGLNFSSPSQGRVSPEGGCPAKFFLARRFRLDGERLTITDANDDVLGNLAPSADGFTGTAASGEKISLNR